jgi:hypothetical protein
MCESRSLVGEGQGEGSYARQRGEESTDRVTCSDTRFVSACRREPLTLPLSHKGRGDSVR